MVAPLVVIGTRAEGGDYDFAPKRSGRCLYVVVRKLRRKKLAEAVVALVPSAQTVRLREEEQA